MVAGLQHDASVSKLKLLELERAVKDHLLTFATQNLSYFPFLERRSHQIPFQSAGGKLTEGRNIPPILLAFDKPMHFIVNCYFLVEEPPSFNYNHILMI